MEWYDVKLGQPEKNDDELKGKLVFYGPRDVAVRPLGKVLRKINDKKCEVEDCDTDQIHTVELKNVDLAAG